MTCFWAALASSLAAAFPVEVAEAPSTTLSLTTSAISSARESILLNIYELSSSEIADALLERIASGVRVEILEEGQPVGGISTAGRGIQARLVQAMRASLPANRLYEMTSHASSARRRFRYNHGKYAVIDGKRLLIASENYSPTGNPRAGTKGNRGWEVFIHDEAIARQYEAIFRKDADPSAGDLVDLTENGVPCRAGIPGCSGLELLLDTGLAAGRFSPPMQRQAPEPAPILPLGAPVTLEADSVQRITSPETSLTGLRAMLRHARQSIDLEQMTLDPRWEKDSVSPLVEEILDAARRGVRVRVLLNDGSVFDHPGRPSRHPNEEALAALAAAASREGLPLEARIADIRRMGVTYIHNKGALVDGEWTLVSSINWNRNSVLNNREAAVLLQSREINAHYLKLFESDWRKSEPAQARADAPREEVRAPGASVRLERDCPAALHLVALLGEVSLPENEDESFAELSHVRIEGGFARLPGSRGCVLSEAGAGRSRPTTQSRFLQIRTRSDGSRTVALEGYTSTGKLYSVRAALGSDEALEGSELAALVYDGSGPTREKLGGALLRLSSEESRD